ncbi:MAG TPA: hypothetical protein VLH39_00145 [Magnetospirillaceae bacterium]|nr:hypothetical protein [Magnetospirillaceae bacterium]
MPIIARVLNLALAAAPKGSRILRVNLRVGAACDAEAVWLERYFRASAQGTQAEGAELVVSRERSRTDPLRDRGAFDYVLESIEVDSVMNPVK